MCRALWLIALASLACDRADPPKKSHVEAVPLSASPTTVVTPSATALPSLAPSEPPAPSETPPVATLSATATAAPTAELPDALGLLNDIAKAKEVKISRLDSTSDAEIKDEKKIGELFEAIGISQRPIDACPKGLQFISLSFTDGFGTRLGSIGLFRQGDTQNLNTDAVVRDALGDRCQGIALEKATALEAMIDEALPAEAKP
jgi:hypothetical protein